MELSLQAMSLSVARPAGVAQSLIYNANIGIPPEVGIGEEDLQVGEKAMLTGSM